MPLADAVRRPLVITLVSSGLFQALSIVTGVVLARTLGPAGRGELGSIVLWPSVLAVLAIVGIPDAISVLTAGRTVTTGDAIRSALPVVGLLALLGVVGAAAVQWIVFVSIDATSRSAAAIYLAFIPINMITMTFAGALSGNHQFGALNAARLSVIAIAAVGLPLLAVAGHLTVLTAVVTYLVANLIALSLAAGFVLRRSASRIGLASWSTARRLLNFGARSQTGAVAGLLGERLDQLLISVILLPMQFGLYLAAVTLGSGAGLIASTMTTVLLPTIAAMSPEFRLAAVRSHLRITALVITAYALIVAVLAPVILSVFFGPEFEVAGVAARILLVGTIPLTLSRTLAAASRASGYPGSASRAEWLGLACAAPAYALLIPAFGVIGAASAFVIAGLATLAFQAAFASSALGAPSAWNLVRTGSREIR
jgi:O-antigen/teichoic acid export membrane protein